ncbi:MAG: hypothetical protein P8J27_00970 [Mariniblastus sp.]|nr:hypothetical protein [Mariniblastus sp.]
MFALACSKSQQVLGNKLLCEFARGELACSMFQQVLGNKLIGEFARGELACSMLKLVLVHNKELE